MKILMIFLMLINLLMVKETEFETKASWYGDKFHGKGVACFKEKYDMNAFTAAGSDKLKCGDLVKVTNLSNGKSVTVVINDRGAFKKYGRDIDLSKKAFSSIADLRTGVIKVKVKIIEKNKTK